MKLYIKENVITDLKNQLSSANLGTDAINYLIKDVKYYMLNTFNINMQDATLKPINKPKGSTTAKRSDNILLGVNSKSTGWGEGMLVGRDQFVDIYQGGYWGKASIRQSFDACDLWFEIVPINDDTYKSLYTIRRQRRDEVGDYFNTYTDTTTGKKRLMLSKEFKLWDVDAAREDYAKRLVDKKTRRNYENILKSVESINDRIKDIDYSGLIISAETYKMSKVSNIANDYSSLKRYLDKISKTIDSDDEQLISEYDVRRVNECVDKINKELDYLTLN
jgi:hypothetical protein